MTPYYQDDWVTIYNGDCLEVMKDIPSYTIDLTVTSPPYDNLRDYDGYVFDFENIAKELYRVTKDGGVVVWVVGDATIKGSETGTSFRQALYFKDIGFNLHDTMIYQKESPPLTHNRYEQHFEYMFIFSVDRPRTFNPMMVKKKWMDKRTNKGFRREKDGSTDMGFCSPKRTRIRGNIWKYNIGLGHSAKDRYVFGHPAIFPEQLAKDHIKSWSNPGDTVLDPFLGSGTTARACKDLGRKCIGIEISKEYCDIAVQRLAQEVLPL
jgi:DNA modification methylase